MTTRVVTVEIHGQRYAVKSDLDQAYIAELATYLDIKMRQAADELAERRTRFAWRSSRRSILPMNCIARADGVQGDGRIVEAAQKAAEIERIVDAVLGGQQRIAV